jgi:pyruvate kinase
MRINYTKIVATLGPSSESYTTIEEMVQAGMDTARLNFSHGSYKNFKDLIDNVRKAAKKHKKIVGILQDLQGPKIRLGILPKEGIKIKRGEKIILSTAVSTYKVSGKPGKLQKELATPVIPVQYKALHKDVKKNNKIFIDDGLIQAQIMKISGKNITCLIKTSGTLYSNKGINVPDATISAKTLTAKDIKDLKFGLTQGVDYVALSFVKSAKDIKDLRNLIKKLTNKSTNSPKIIAKIERHEAIDNLEEIIQETDGVMVARGDLGIEIPPEKVPIIQKAIIKLANRYAKPVITATQVLSSMVENPRPTRAEISDAANAVFDNTDAIMLSNETAIGAYPVKAVQTLAKVISAVENDQKKHEEILQTKIQNNTLPQLNATCLSACELALNSNADKVIIYSKDGYTVRQVIKHRVFIPTLIVTPNPQLIQELSLCWGINQSLYKKFTQQELKGSFTSTITRFLKSTKTVNSGEKIVIVYNAKNKGSVASLTV